MVIGPFFHPRQHSRQLNSLAADCNEAKEITAFMAFLEERVSAALRFRGTMLRNQIGTRKYPLVSRTGEPNAELLLLLTLD